jgi:hypothetical protein
MEKFEHDPVLDNKRTPESKERDKANTKQDQGLKSGSSEKFVGGKKVATWVSLFQNDEDNMVLETSELGQYSCMKLLKELRL